MEESECKDFLDNYRKVLFQCDNENPDPLISASVQRRCLSQLYQAATKTLDNSDLCTLLESKLKSYAETVDNNGSNIYQERVRAKLSNMKIQPRRKPVTESSQLKLPAPVPLPLTLTPLSCSESQITCETSENYSESDYQQFIGIFQQKVTKVQKETELIARGIVSEKRDHRDMKFGSNECLGASKPEDNLPKTKGAASCFKTAHEELQQQTVKKYGNAAPGVQSGGQKRKLGMRRNINSKFISPLLSNGSEEMSPKSEEWPAEMDDRLKNIDPKMVELIKSEIMDVGPTIEWNDIAGLEFAKTAIQEAVVWPMLRPDIFTGLRRPPKGILLFGPPGTGKTLIGKCVASQSRSTFFSISASSLTSKWIGDGEKMVRALFTVARCHQPAVIFIDEIDSLLSQRSDTEHESSRRIKTEFLVQLDGATTENEERLLVIGATNRPQELDEAARRRFVKRLYIPLPELDARLQLIKKLIADEQNTLKDDHYVELAKLTNGYSGADIRSLCAEASMGPIRSLDFGSIEKIQVNEVRPLMIEDFEKALLRVKSSVSANDLNQYITWNDTYGSGL